jgi:hypothetical protein
MRGYALVFERPCIKLAQKIRHSKIEGIEAGHRFC